MLRLLSFNIFFTSSNSITSWFLLRLIKNKIIGFPNSQLSINGNCFTVNTENGKLNMDRLKPCKEESINQTQQNVNATQNQTVGIQQNQTVGIQPLESNKKPTINQWIAKGDEMAKKEYNEFPKDYDKTNLLSQQFGRGMKFFIQRFGDLGLGTSPQVKDRKSVV